jgi:ArsR family transcriptional regulator, arsenate/arsenite/antimonite-responsive transcriptional repressor
MQDLLSITSSLADESRLRILAALDAGELCVCQIIELLALAPSTVSKHLLLLKHAGLIESRKQGRWMYYRLADDAAAAPPVRETLAWFRRVQALQPALAADAAKLKSIVAVDPEVLCCSQRQTGRGGNCCLPSIPACNPSSGGCC